MEFERLVSSLDAEALARAAETLLRLLSGGGAAERGPFLSVSGPERESRQSGASPLSAPGAAGPLPGASGAEINALAAEEETLSAFAAVPGGKAAEKTERAARIEARPGTGAERKARPPEAEAAEGPARTEARPGAGAERRARPPGAEAEGPVRTGTRPDAVAERKARLTETEAAEAEAAARLEERLAAVSERNRRSLGAGTETVSPYASADGSATAGAGAAGPSWSPAFSAPPAAGSGAAAILREADTAAAPGAVSAAERDYFDAEAMSEFFRRDSRRYDSVFSD